MKSVKKIKTWCQKFWWPILWRKIKEEEEITRRLCIEWAEDHDHLQELCRQAGCSEYEVEGDSYGVPGIKQLADELKKRIPPV